MNKKHCPQLATCCTEKCTKHMQDLPHSSLHSCLTAVPTALCQSLATTCLVWQGSCVRVHIAKVLAEYYSAEDPGVACKTSPPPGSSAHTANSLQNHVDCANQAYRVFTNVGGWKGAKVMALAGVFADDVSVVRTASKWVS
jgi:hypothetical protein